MSTPQQAQKPRPLDKRSVRVALASLGWTQAELATRLGKSLTAVNLSINHNTYPAITDAIRQALKLS